MVPAAPGSALDSRQTGLAARRRLNPHLTKSVRTSEPTVLPVCSTAQRLGNDGQETEAGFVLVPGSGNTELPRRARLTTDPS